MIPATQMACEKLVAREQRVLVYRKAKSSPGGLLRGVKAVMVQDARHTFNELIRRPRYVFCWDKRLTKLLTPRDQIYLFIKQKNEGKKKKSVGMLFCGGSMGCGSEGGGCGGLCKDDSVRYRGIGEGVPWRAAVLARLYAGGHIEWLTQILVEARSELMMGSLLLRCAGGNGVGGATSHVGYGRLHNWIFHTENQLLISPRWIIWYA